MSKLLLIDDDEDILSLNKRYLQKQGYEVKIATDAKQGIDLLKTYQADCIVLDIMLPDMNGFDASLQIKSMTNAPFIFLTGLSSESNKLKGLYLGGNDYIVKPYSLKELAARIKVQLRLHKKQISTDTLLSYPPLTLNLSLHQAYYEDEVIQLTNKEFDLLHILLANVNQVVTFEMIGQALWGTYQDTDRRTIMVTASRLRKKFETYIELESKIETVWSKGYKFTYQSR